MKSSPDIRILTAESVGLLKQMVEIPSPSFMESDVCSHICRWMEMRGIAHERIGNNIIAEQKGKNKDITLMLCAHIDTVGASDDYSFDPYSPQYDVAAEAVGRMTGKDCGPEDIVAGLGSNDDGASAVSMIAVYRYFLEVVSPVNLTLVLTCEEERSGKNGMTGLWGSRLCGKGESGEGCTAIDLAIVGEPTGMKAATSERGLLVIDATAHGTSGHAARNEGINALYKALDDISRIRGHRFTRISPEMGEVNVNVTQINAGSAHNVIPDRCDFVIDIRPTERYSNEEILAELQSICQSTLRPRNLANRSSATREGSPLKKAAEAIGTGTFSSPTTSDWMRIGCDAIKMGPGESSRSHKKDEFVFVSEIEEGTEKYIEFINNIK